MRRTTICLVIIALFLGGPVWAQEVVPSGQATLPTLPMAPVAAPDATVPSNPGGTEQTIPQTSPDQSGQPPQQQWQPMETIVPMPDVTTSGTTMPDGVMSMTPMVEERPHGPCCEKTGRGYCCPPNGYVDQRVRWLHHPKPRGTITGKYGSIGQAYDGTQFIDVFTTRDGMSTRTVPFEPAAGYEITIGRYLGRDSENRDHFIEFTYYGLNNWEQSCAIHETDRPQITNGTLWPNQEQISFSQLVTFGNLYSVFDPDLAGFNRADDLSERYASRFDNFELNARIHPRLRHDRMVLYQNGQWTREAQNGYTGSFLIGLRGISLDESFQLLGTGQIITDEYDVVNPPETTTATTTGEYNIRTHNDMVGLQIGADVVYRQGFAEFGMRIKSGVFINFADQYSTLVSTGGLDDPMANTELYDANGKYTNVNNQYSEERFGRSRDVAGLAEFGFTASYQVRRNMVIRAAYDLMWLNGLALAPEQVDGQIGAPDRINRNGLQMLQSLSLGVELDW
ncbi:MAG: BBP7 family outer membrane beta-barrel protein [Pirellulales bacterium]|nr:BBP7 family outer membrane beta-barrel protein [Pirellulales bacterium]